jgi:hypothetical protein
VAMRAAMDHAERVTHLAVLDCIPIVERKIWTAWTTDLRGSGRIDSGHHMAEEAPGQLAAELARFLAV